ncbi:hypothetical protein Q3O60_10375 [Alkalimonas collagenimarina]|uniref:Ice-binding protein C-terminal domain-containing protein n=1 Tax=Alkalimonas collagenimarina TaxID=400390 RepID=A0ABT9GZW3_9GAMM|nr:hypothetical protein [Alkalimonas collagenimarina]MDP4536594.1 hypothetical protein [Alkalimonas collagenimarina]
MSKHLIAGLAFVGFVALTTGKAEAGLVTPTFNNENCSAVTLTSVSNLGAPGTNLLSQSYNANQCIGFIGPNPSHNDDPFNNINNPTTNIGYLGDGLLNGGVHNGNQYFIGTEFIDQSDLQDLQTSGNFIDPGWIHLGHFNGDNSNWTYSSLGTGLVKDDEPVTPLNIADLLELSLDCTSGNANDCKAGTWTISTKLDIIEQVQALLGPATFDHLAFSIKAGPSFVVYDFNFKNIFANENDPLLNFNTPYILSGTFNTSDLGNKGVSHLNIMARDPIDTTTVDVPAPATLAILGLGLLVLRLFRR